MNDDLNVVVEYLSKDHNRYKVGLCIKGGLNNKYSVVTKCFGADTTLELMDTTLELLKPLFPAHISNEIFRLVDVNALFEIVVVGDSNKTNNINIKNSLKFDYLLSILQSYDEEMQRKYSFNTRVVFESPKIAKILLFEIKSDPIYSNGVVINSGRIPIEILEKIKVIIQDSVNYKTKRKNNVILSETGSIILDRDSVTVQIFGYHERAITMTLDLEDIVIKEL